MVWYVGLIGRYLLGSCQKLVIDMEYRAWQIALNIAGESLSQEDLFSVASTCKELKHIVDAEVFSVPSLQGGESLLRWLEIRTLSSSPPLRVNKLKLVEIPWSSVERIDQALRNAAAGVEHLTITFFEEEEEEDEFSTTHFMIPEGIFQSLQTLCIVSLKEHSSSLCPPSSSYSHSIVVKKAVASPVLHRIEVFGFSIVHLQEVYAPRLSIAIFDGRSIWVPSEVEILDELVLCKAVMWTNIDRILKPHSTRIITAVCDDMNEPRLGFLAQSVATVAPIKFKVDVQAVFPCRVPNFFSAFHDLCILDIPAPAIQSDHDLESLFLIGNLNIVVFRRMADVYISQRAAITSHPMFAYAYETADSLIAFTGNSLYDSFASDAVTDVQPSIFHWIAELPDVIDTAAVQNMVRIVPSVSAIFVWRIGGVQDMIDKFATLPHRPSFHFIDIGNEMVFTIGVVSIVRPVPLDL